MLGAYWCVSVLTVFVSNSLSILLDISEDICLFMILV